MFAGGQPVAEFVRLSAYLWKAVRALVYQFEMALLNFAVNARRRS